MVVSIRLSYHVVASINISEDSLWSNPLDPGQKMEKGNRSTRPWNYKAGQTHTFEDNPWPNCMPSYRYHLSGQVPKQLPDELICIWNGKDLFLVTWNRCRLEQIWRTSNQVRWSKWSKIIDQLTQKWVQNICDTLHIDGIIQLYKPTSQHCSLMSDRKMNLKKKWQKFLFQAPWIFLL